LSAFRDVQLEVDAASTPVDIVAKGFDAGIDPKKLGGRGHDRVSGNASNESGRGRCAPLRRPARRAPPTTLTRHSCVQYRRAAESIFEWPFERDGKSLRTDGGAFCSDRLNAPEH
jgi:hypothetical protein